MGLGFFEIAVVFLVALIFVGPKKLPGLARSIGRGMHQFRKGMQDLERAVQETVTVEETEPPKPPTRLETPNDTDEPDTHPEEMN